jgi:hypothetical protein
MAVTVTLIGDACRAQVRLRDAVFEVDAAGMQQLAWVLADARRQMQPPLVCDVETARQFREDPGTAIAVSIEADATHVALVHPGLGAIGVRLSPNEMVWLVEQLAGTAH